MAFSTLISLAVFLVYSTCAVQASPITTASQINCVDLPAPANGAIETVYSTTYQLLAVFTCNEGYAAVGETVLTCVDGEWDDISPFCASVDYCNLRAVEQKVPVDESLLKCGKLSAPRFGNVDMVIGDDGEFEIATFSCVPGYYVSGASALHCERGVWDGHEPECEPIDCGAPEPPINGTVEYEHTLYRSVAHYKCDACYQLEGFESRTCKRSGLWSKTAPNCVPSNRIACPLPSIPGGGYLPDERGLKISGIACGQDVTIQCFSGYRLIGTRTATCNPDGSYRWHGPTPRCRRLRWTR